MSYIYISFTFHGLSLLVKSLYLLFSKYFFTLSCRKETNMEIFFQRNMWKLEGYKKRQCGVPSCCYKLQVVQVQRENEEHLKVKLKHQQHRFQAKRQRKFSIWHFYCLCIVLHSAHDCALRYNFVIVVILWNKQPILQNM